MNTNSIYITEKIESNIQAKARLFAKNGKLGNLEVQDIEQELYMAVFKGIRNYNPELASLDTFCDRIIKNKIKKLARKHYANKNLMILYAEQLKENDLSRNSTHYNVLDESMSADFSVSFPLHVMDIQSDIKGMLDKLPEELKAFSLEIIKGTSLNQIAREKKLSKYTLYKKYINPIRRLCKEWHIHEYLDKSILLRGFSCVL